MSDRHKWVFRARFRTGAYGWKGSRLACERLKEAVSEIKNVARHDGIAAAEGAVILMERIWPAFEGIDTSSGALGSAVWWTIDDLIPVLAAAPADQKTRDRWLDRLWQAIQDDGVSYLDLLEDRWGEICGSPETASKWADEILPLLRTAWTDPRPGSYVGGTSLCLSSLLAAGRHQEILDILALERHPFWPFRRFGVRALLAQGRTADALAYAEASRGLNSPNMSIDAECEAILLGMGHREEAYQRYALTANQANTGIATFRMLAKKYPEIEPRRILVDLAEMSAEPGKWFAAAKDAGLHDLALEFATTGRTDPCTLSRAARDFVVKDTPFALRVGRIAIERMLQGYGYDLTGADMADAYERFMAAAERLGVAETARADMKKLALEAGPEAAILRRVLLEILERRTI